jgi:glutamyl-tRNA reductase
MIDDRIRQFHTDNSLIVIGANHRSSTMLLRDKLYISEPDLPPFYKRLRAMGFDEIIILSTTDLTEFILTTQKQLSQKLSIEVIKLLSAYVSESRNNIKHQTYCLIDQEAVRHVFAVAATLDGLVIGDTRIKEHLNRAYQIARNNGAISDYLITLITSAKKIAERVARETEIGRRPISIAAAAVQIAHDLHGELTHSSCLLIGAGEMGEMLAASMRSAGVKQLLVSHPSSTRAEIVSKILNCHVGEIENLTQLLTQSDIVITSMNTRKFILNDSILKKAIKARRRKPIFIIDTGVPGDVDPSIEKLEDVFIYTLDDLERATKKGRTSSADEAQRAWAIIDGEIKKIGINNLKKKVIAPLNRTNNIEKSRQPALMEFGGNAEKSTQLLPNQVKDISGLEKEPN